jgi:NitT/TauT family transport system substrate-binding protein
MKKLFLVLLTLTLAACGGTQINAPAPTAASPVKVKLSMGYIPDVQFAPFYVAAEKGYFKEQGLEVEFVTQFENDSVPLLGTNQLQFAIVSAEQVVQARAQGLPIKYVWAWYQKFPVAVVAKASSGIKTPGDLANRKIGLPGLYGASYIGLRALLKSQKIAEKDVKLESVGFTQVEVLSVDKVEAVVGYANKLKALGHNVNTIYVSDFATLAGNGLVTNEKTLSENPKLVRAMVTAANKGLADVIAKPEEGVDVSKKYVEALGKGDAATLKIAREVLDASIALWKAPTPGMSDKAKWEAIQATLLDMNLIPAPVDLEKTFTNEFIK